MDNEATHEGPHRETVPATATSPDAAAGCGATGMDHGLAEGQRVGRYVILRDVEGQRHAVAAGAVAALGETADGALILLPGGRMIHVPRPMSGVIRWLST